MGALAVDLDMQLDFWTAPELERASKPVLAAVVRDQPVGGERTLEDLVLGAWEELAAHHTVSCLVCGGVMRSGSGSAGAPAMTATCEDCGSQLS